MRQLLINTLPFAKFSQNVLLVLTQDFQEMEVTVQNNYFGCIKFEGKSATYLLQDGV